MKYIFVAGAPGSKWSSVVKNIYYSSDIDRSDYKDEWTYYHDASGEYQLMHLGAYFDPGMASDLPENFSDLSRAELEKIFNSPFESNEGKYRIIKAHIFANNIDFLKQKFPESPIVLVHRSDDSCLGWWVKCGHFDITYPSYQHYYKDLKHMASVIKQQNTGLLQAWHNYHGIEPQTNRLLASFLKIECPPIEYIQDYSTNDIKVKII